MTRTGWHRDSARHSLAARGVRSVPSKSRKMKEIVQRRAWVTSARKRGIPTYALEEMTPEKARTIMNIDCEYCQKVLAEAKRQHRNVVFNWDGYHVVALGKKRS